MAAGDYLHFHEFVHNLAEGKFDFAADTLELALTNTPPTPATDSVFNLGTFPAPAAANGYTVKALTTTHALAGNVFTLGCVNPVVWTATAGGIGPFQYVILYDQTAPSDELIGYYDYGGPVNLAVGETFTVTPTVSLLTITVT